MNFPSFEEHKEALTIAEELQQKNYQTIIELIRERDAAFKELLDAKEKQRQHENKEIKEQLSKSNEDLKKEQTKTHELNQKLYKFEDSQFFG